MLYISLHRYDNGSFFPANSDNNFTHVGEDAGKFFNLNLPFSQGAKGDGDYLAAFLHTVMPVAHQFNPELVLISGGFDAAKGDPLGGYHLSPALYAHLTHLLMGLAGGRVILALEGGYNLTVIPECFAACLRAMLADPIPLLSQSTTNCSPAALQTIWDVNELWGRKWSSISRFAVKFPIKPSSPRRVAASKVETQAEPQSDRLDPDSFNLESLRDSLQS